MNSAEEFEGTSEFEGSSFTSFEDAVLQALPPPTSSQPETFIVVQFRVQRGGFVGIPQYMATVRRS